MPVSRSEVALVTTTLYTAIGEDATQTVRAEIAKNAINNAALAGFQMYVVDGGSDDSFLSAIRNSGAIVQVDKDSDMMESRQKVARLAVDSRSTKFVVWTEPEKNVTPWALQWAQVCEDLNASVVLPMRDSVASYPLSQQHSERRANQDIARRFRREMGDWYFGPRLLTAEAIKSYWLAYDGAAGEHGRLWPCVYAPVFMALASGARVVAVTSPFAYPEAQSKIEAQDGRLDAKRALQRAAITETVEVLLKRLEWAPNWQFAMPDGFTLASQGISITDETTSADTESVSS